MDNSLVVPTGITVEFSCLNKLGLTADLYLLLHWKYHNNYTLPTTLTNMYLDDDPMYLEYLEENGYIKITGDREFEVRQKAIDLFKKDNLEESWLEFLGKYPIKVPARNGGSRALKVASPNSKANEKISKKYIALIKNKPELHRQIIDVLEAEVAMRKKSGQLQYMNAMDVWLNQANYDKYAYLLEENVEKDYKSEDYM